jgi:hypothetical protein
MRGVRSGPAESRKLPPVDSGDFTSLSPRQQPWTPLTIVVVLCQHSLDVHHESGCLFTCQSLENEIEEGSPISSRHRHRHRHLDSSTPTAFWKQIPPHHQLIEPHRRQQCRPPPPPGPSTTSNPSPASPSRNSTLNPAPPLQYSAACFPTWPRRSSWPCSTSPVP